MRAIGCFPKSMFTTDFESAKNCLRVLRSGGVLAMMPEARLSTAGEFEDIQPGTYSFLKSAKVPVYSINLYGNYLADPKWGNGMRRGARVEAELDILFTAEELRTLSVEQIRTRVEQRLYYNDFTWLATRPDIHYRCAKLAQGLENILSYCPVCHRPYTLRAQGHDLSCEHCGKLTTLDDRYHFAPNFIYETPQAWYADQKRALKLEIEQDEEYSLTSHVELRLPSDNGRTLLRHAGDGVCTLDRTGLTYRGTRDGENTVLHFPMAEIYRLLFGAGENFEIYMGNRIYYFVPDEKRSCVTWYLASMILKDLSECPLEQHDAVSIKS
jgi:hypothetical protein